ncbi:MAG: hypothetical protein ACK54X_12330 [Burkholderiales bacterium]|jgi:hypothetical protein
MNLKRWIPTVRAALAVATLGAVAGTALAATAEPSGLDPELAAKVARERAKQNRRGAELGDAGGNDKGGCGQVDIGNDNSKDRSAASRVIERNRTVIVTGPVINAARCR